MASSPVEIVNGALHLLGQAPILSLEDDTDAARAANALYPNALRSLLRQRRWNFALTRASLSRLSAAPAWGWAYAFSLPADCLRVWETELEREYPWKVEGLTLVTDADEANALYSKYVTSTAQYDALFTDCLIARLARDLAWPITSQRGVVTDMDALFQAKLKEAATADGQEGTPSTYGRWDDLTRVR